MYEEIDERYQEKRLLMLQAQNSQIEHQIQRRLLAAYHAGQNSSRQQAVSRERGVQKLHIDIASQSPNFWSSVSTPPPSAGLTPSYASACSSPEAAYFAQMHNTHSSTLPPNNYVQDHQAVPGYLSPSLSPASGASNLSNYFPDTPPQARATAFPPSNNWNDQPFRQRLASLPENVLMRSMPMTTLASPQLQDSNRMDGPGSRAQSEPVQSEGESFSFHGWPAPIPEEPFTLPIETLSPPELSTSTTSDSSPESSAGDQIFLSPCSMGLVEPPDVGFDADFYAFNQFAHTLGNITQISPETVPFSPHSGDPNVNALLDWTSLENPNCTI